MNEIVSLKKLKDSSERESSRREVHVKQVETEANKGLDALREAEERIAMLRTQVEDISGYGIGRIISCWSSGTTGGNLN